MEAMQKRRLDSEMFGEDGRLYFIDLLQAKNKKAYLQITRADYKAKEKYERSSIILFEDDFEFFVEAVAMVLGRYSHGEGGRRNGKYQINGTDGASKGKVTIEWRGSVE